LGLLFFLVRRFHWQTTKIVGSIAV
jgi:hypothetical protein